MKKILSIVLAAIMVMALGVTAFAAETSTSMTSPRFVKSSGEELSLNMGTSVVDQTKTAIVDGMYHVYFSELSLLGYTGVIVDVLYNGESVCVEDENGVIYAELDPEWVVATSTSGVNGIPVTLDFDFEFLGSSSNPPMGMSDPMSAYFTFNELNITE